MLYEKLFRLVMRFLAGRIPLVAGSSAQTVAYRQTNLASAISTAGFANAALRNSWGIALQPGASFLIANAGSGRVTAHDATGASRRPGAFFVANLAANGPASPTSSSPANTAIVSILVTAQSGVVSTTISVTVD